jgi:hypothetical protein
MNHHEREFFIANIRSGKHCIRTKGLFVYILPPTLDQVQESCFIYQEAYDQAYVDGVMTESDMTDWMYENNLWTYEDDAKLATIQKDLERLKTEIYNARNDSKLAHKIRFYIRACEKELNKQNLKKNQFFQNTCEGVASTEKITWIVKNTTLCNNKNYDFSEISLTYIVDEWQSSFLSESKIRDLARNEPWRSLWSIKNNVNFKLFQNEHDYDLTYNQKNIVIWSQMYDNIQESLECPTKDVINDDDMLDGWFIIQSKKRDKERAESEFENGVKSQKIKNASEVYIIGKNEKDKERINSMNSVQGNMIKKQREQLIKTKGGAATQLDFVDERQKLQMQSNQDYIRKIKGGR